ncbi:MAG: hypothetical protein HYR85_27090 [Planctomycetes bacterium]|nr:hypothetical protein [Planctomycetota bacterium]
MHRSRAQGSSCRRLLVALLSLSAAAFADESVGFPKGIVPPRVPNPVMQRALAEANGPWREFVERQGEGWTIAFDEDSSMPSLLVAPGVRLTSGPLTASSVRAAALAFARDNEALFGTTGLVLTGEAALRGTVWVMNFDVSRDGIPFSRWSSVKFRFKDPVSALQAVFLDRMPRSVEPAQVTVDLGAAIVAAMAEVPAGVAGVEAGTADLQYHVTPDGSGRLAWHFILANHDVDPYDHEFYVAARGAADVLLDWNEIFHVDVTGNVSGQGHIFDPVTPTISLPLRDLRVAISGGNSAFTDASGNYTITNAGSSPVTVTADLSGRWVNVNNNAGADLAFSGSATPGTPLPIVFNSGGGPAASTCQVDVFYHVTNEHNVVASRIGASALDAQIIANVNLAQTCNAFFSPGADNINFFSAGGGCNNTGYDTVVYHEWGHHFDYTFGGIVDGGLSEGIGDVMSSFLTGQNILGENFFTNGNFVRNADNSAQWPATSCGGEVHCLGEVFSGFAYHSRANLIATLGSVAGPQLAQPIFFNAIAANPSSQPNAVMDVYLQDDNDANLANGTPHCNELEAARVQHSYPVLPGFVCSPFITLNVTPLLENTGNSVEPYRVLATATTTTGAISMMELFYSVDAGAFTTINMTPTVNADEYAGLIPPQACPSVVRYYVRATDSATHSTVLPPRAPGASQENTYRMSIGSVSPSSNLDPERGGAGFTHAGSPDFWSLTFSFFAHTGNNVWHSQPASVSDDNRLQSPTITLPGDASLSFWHTYSLASGLDGGVIEITTDNGAHWTDLGSRISTGAYNGAISAGNGNPIAGRSAWTGGTVGAMTQVVVDLSGFSGPSKLRWRLGSAGGGAGQTRAWILDDILVSTLGCSTQLTVTDDTPSLGQQVTFTVTGPPSVPVDLLVAGGIGQAIVTLPGGRGSVQTDLRAPVQIRVTNATNGAGTFTLTARVPNQANLVGRTFYIQAVLASAIRTNLTRATITSPP